MTDEQLPVETISDRDEFGNYETDRFSCPRCGADRVVYVFQFDSWMCATSECKWVIGGILGGGEGIEPIPAMKRSALPWQEIWPEMAAAELPPVESDTDDQRVLREIMNPVNVGWAHGLPLGEH